jgi:twinkle protein
MYAAVVLNKDYARTTCVVCSDGRKHNNDECVSVGRKGDWVVWNCHHCGDKGSAPVNEWKPKNKVERPTFKVDVNFGMAPEAIEYLALRGILEETAKLAQLFTCERSFRSGKQMSIGFPNILNGKVVGVKYRGLNKEFSQEAGSEQSLWGQQFAKPPVLIITEGEIDALSAAQCGFSAVSVPGGAPLRVSDGKIDPTEDRKFSYVWEGKSLLDSMEKVILAVDNDEPGQALQEELARRIGKARCWTVEYPQGCKDLNDVLVRHGEQEVKNVISGAKPYPINGLFEADSYFSGVDERYQNGFGSGNSTGYSSVDQLYTIVPGQMSVVTGWPSSGKSNFVDQVCVNLAREKDWRFLMASFENPPQEHIIKLCEIFLEKPFYQGPTERMTQQELDLAKQWVRDHFLFLDVANGGTSLDSILARGQAAVARMGIRGMVIDPYNYIDIERTGTEAADISNMLTRVNAFAKTNEVHIWFVAHPAKMLREGKELPVPDGMAIAGSMSWWAKADFGVTIHRTTSDVLVKIWKSRWRWAGKIGETFLQYDRATGTYEEIPF